MLESQVGIAKFGVRVGEQFGIQWQRAMGCREGERTTTTKVTAERSISHRDLGSARRRRQAQDVKRVAHHACQPGQPATDSLNPHSSPDAIYGPIVPEAARKDPELCRACKFQRT